MNINIHGPVNAGSMIVGGHDVNIGGDINAAVASPSDALSIVRDLRTAIGTLDLPAWTRTQASTQLNAIENEVDTHRPNKASIADKLGRLTNVLNAAGALATAGTGVVPMILRLAVWLGEHGRAIIGMLPR
jgi:hypothetical protein